MVTSTTPDPTRTSLASILATPYTIDPGSWPEFVFSVSSSWPGGPNPEIDPVLLTGATAVPGVAYHSQTDDYSIWGVCPVGYTTLPGNNLNITTTYISYSSTCYPWTQGLTTTVCDYSPTASTTATVAICCRM
jgi:hypothetical protein